MRKLIVLYALIFLALCGAWQCFAASQLPLLGVGKHGAGGGGGSYSGPNNVTTSQATIFFSCARAVSASYASGGGNLCDIVDTATGLSTCTIIAGTNGFAALSGTNCTGGVGVTTFCTVTHAAGCSVTKAYDQVGTACSGGTGTRCDALQATLSQMPGLALNYSNSLPCMTFTGSASQQLTMPSGSTSGSYSQPNGETAVANRSSAVTGSFETAFSISGNLTIGVNNSANSLQLNAGTSVNFTASDNTLHAVNVNFNGASGSYTLDGTTTTSQNMGTNNIGTFNVPYIGGVNGNYFTGSVCEGGAYGSGLSTTDQGLLNTNQHGTNGYNF